MRKLLPPDAYLTCIDATGGSYLIQLNFEDSSIDCAILDTASTSYKASVSSLETTSFLTLDVAGNSYTSSLSGTIVKAPPTEEETPPQPDVEETTIFTIGYGPVLPPDEILESLSLGEINYVSGYLTENVVYSVPNKYIEDASETISLTSLGYTYGLTPYKKRIYTTFEFQYIDKISKTFDIGFFHSLRFQKQLLVNAPNEGIKVSNYLTTVYHTFGNSVKAAFQLPSGFNSTRLLKDFSIANLYLEARLITTLEIPSGFNSTRLFKDFSIANLHLKDRLAYAFEIPSGFNSTRLFKDFSIAYLPLKDRVFASLNLTFTSYNRIRNSFSIYPKLLHNIHVSTNTSYRVFSEDLATPFKIASPLYDLVRYAANIKSDLTVPVKFNTTSGYIIFNEAKKEFTSTYHILGKVYSTFALDYEVKLTNRLRKSLNLTYMSVISVVPIINDYDQTVVQIPTSLDSPLIPSGSIIVNNTDGTSTITTPAGIVYKQMATGDFIPISHSGTIVNQTQNIDILAVEPLLVINGEYVYVTEMSISIDEGNFTYTLNAKLGNYTDLSKFMPDDEFYAVLQGEVYSFIVDSRSINRQDINAPAASIKGVSLSNKLTGNRSKQIIGTTFTEGESAKEIASRILNDPLVNRSNYRLPLDLLSWETLDWEIPKFRFAIENTFPLDGVKKLAEAVGALVEAYPDGRVRVRPKHTVRVPDYSDATISHSFIDEDDIFSIEEQFAPNRKVDSIYVKTFQDIGTTDTIEFFDQPGLANVDFGGFVRVFPAFWREKIELSTTRRNDTILEYLGVEEWRPGEIDPPDFGWETIEIVRSQGSTRYPIHRIIGYQYLDTNCGDLILQEYSKTFYTSSETERFSMIKLSYTTLCHKWRVTAPGGAHLQFLIKDNVFSSYLR